MVTPDTEVVVIGAGVVGLAIAAKLASSGRDVIVLERELSIGTQTSSRNSEVIHAGIYYKPGSLKAELCLRGKQMLYDFCDTYKVDYSRCGKLIVAATPDEESKLSTLNQNAIASGVNDLEIWDRKKVMAHEPELEVISGLYSPSTGIVDSHAFMLALQGILENYGGVIAFGTNAAGMNIESNLLKIGVSGDDPYDISTRWVINAAGFDAQALARSVDQPTAEHVPDLHLAKGCYFSLSGKSPFQRLIYPSPVDGGLGIHATLDLGGQCRFGPDVEWITSLDYTFPEDREPIFRKAVARYWPSISERELTPGYTGIRPKLSGPGAGFQDYLIQRYITASNSGLINLFGIESPGLTSSLAIAEYVRKQIETP
ncbi:MAG: NAD(P)/FAD-dependent oxidoreductase [Henriciella sp.]